MAKKTSILGYLYLIGMALVVAGCFLPLSSHFGGNLKGVTAVSRIGEGGTLSIGAILALAGAAAGLVLCFIPVKNAKLLKLCAVLVSVAGGLYVVANTNGKALKFAASLTASHFGIGFYVIVIGWVLALAGWVLHKN
ncbi:MAG: hypothetical protein K6G80_10445 [Treponema sp.]|nr:hypothetical protein [Treponema sp.]